MPNQPTAIVKEIAPDLPIKKVQAKVVLTSLQNYHFVAVSDIIYLKSEGNYCNVILREDDSHLCSKTMKSIFNKLPRNFIRVHNSYVINKEYIDKIDTALSRITMMDRSEVPISRSYRSEVKSYIHSLIN